MPKMHSEMGRLGSHRILEVLQILLHNCCAYILKL